MVILLPLWRQEHRSRAMLIINWIFCNLDVRHSNGHENPHCWSIIVKISRSAIIARWDRCYDPVLLWVVSCRQRTGIHCNQQTSTVQLCKSVHSHCFNCPQLQQLQDHQIFLKVGVAWVGEYQCLWYQGRPGVNSNEGPERPVSHFALNKKCTLTNGCVWKTQNGMHIENEVIRLMKRGMAKKVSGSAHALCAVNISLSATVKAVGAS